MSKETPEAKYTDEQYLNCGFYLPSRDGGEEMYSSKIVRCRKEHTCAFCGKTINAGEKAMYEKALIWDEWGSAYTCLHCLDTWIEDSEQYQD